MHYIYFLTYFAKHSSICHLTKSNMVFSIINNEAPEYLSELIPPTVAESNTYNLRNRHNISQDKLNSTLCRYILDSNILYNYYTLIFVEPISTVIPLNI
jgi:hypothetical protein